MIAFTLRAKGIDPFEAQTVTVDGKAMVVGNGLVSGVAAVLRTH